MRERSGACIHVHFVEIRGGHWGSSPITALPYALRQGPSLNQKLRFLAQQSPRIHLSYKARVMGACNQARLLTWMLRIRAQQGPMLTQQALVLILSALTLPFMSGEAIAIASQRVTTKI